MVCVGPVASRPAIYVFGVRLKAWAVLGGLGRAIGSVRLTGRLAACLCCVCPSRKCVLGPCEWAAALPGVHCTGRKGMAPKGLCVVWGIGMAQKVRLKRPGFTSCRAGESGGWIGNNRKDGREVQVCCGHGQLSGSGSAFGGCPSQGLPVRSRNASQWCRVRKRRGEAQTCWALLPTPSGV